MARSFFSEQECRDIGFSEPMIRTLRLIADFVALVSQSNTTTDDLAGVSAAVVALDGRVDTLETFENAGPYVKQDVGAAWTDPTATASRGAVGNYTAPTISATYTQAEVQAIATQLEALTHAVAGIITDLRANGALA